MYVCICIKPTLWDTFQQAWETNRLPRGHGGKESTYQCKSHRRCGFLTWVGKIPWRRARQPTPVFWPREFHGLYSPWGRWVRIRLSNCHFTSRPPGGRPAPLCSERGRILKSNPSEQIAYKQSTKARVCLEKWVQRNLGALWERERTRPLGA